MAHGCAGLQAALRCEDQRVGQRACVRACVGLLAARCWLLGTERATQRTAAIVVQAVPGQKAPRGDTASARPSQWAVVLLSAESAR